MKKIQLNNKILMTAAILLLSSPLWAIGTPAPDKDWYKTDGTFWILIAVAVILFYVIYALSEIVIWGGKKKMEERKGGKTNMIALLIASGLLLLSQHVNAQAVASSAPAAKDQFPLMHSPYLPLYILIAIEIFVITYLTLMLAQYTRKEKSAAATGKYESWLSRTWEKWNYKVPIEREEDMLLRDHEYDGIQELDNTMPPWLQYIFFATIIFAICYLWYYNLGSGPNQIEEYEASVKKANIEMAAYLEKASANYDENTVKLSADPAVWAAGKETFTKFCVTCHGANAEGGVGPNLTDDYWIHGGRINDLFTTVKYGVAGKAMASWKEILSPKQIFEVTNYIKSLHGTNPPNAKAPDGNLYVEGGAAPDSLAAPVDTLKTMDTLQTK